VAKANVAALLSDVSDQAFNIGNCEETSLKQLLNVLLKVNESKLTPQFREENTINPVSRRLADNSKAKRLLNFEPSVSLEKGLYELSQWYFEKKQATIF
jgi:UDP-glucose 4-epimerase